MAGDDVLAWTHFPHEGGVGICGFGGGAAEAFENAARAMTAVVVPLEALESRESVAVAVEAPDLEVLLVDWLNAVIYEMATRRMLFRDFRVEHGGRRLHVELGLDKAVFAEPGQVRSQLCGRMDGPDVGRAAEFRMFFSLTHAPPDHRAHRA